MAAFRRVVPGPAGRQARDEMAAQTFTGRKRVRKFFGKIQEVAEMPNLIEVQKASYDQFLLVKEPIGGRPDEGLQAVFKSVFPISDFSNTSMLEFVHYEFEPPKYDVDECRQRGMTYAAPLKVTLRLIVFDIDEETGAKSVKDIKEQDVYMGDIPLMTSNGTFIVNGTERVIVSQLHRSPGVFFETANNRTYFLGKIIPYRGSWVEFEYDQKNILYVRIDRKRKFLGTIFLRALGLRTGEDILKTFYTTDRLVIKDKKLFWTIDPAGDKPTNLLGMKLARSIKNKSGEEIAHSGRKLNAATLKELQKARITEIEVDITDLEGAWVAGDAVDTTTGEVLLEANSELAADKLSKILDSGVVELNLFFPERDDVGTVISQTLKRDSVNTPQEALIEIYRKLRPGDPPTLDTATALFHGMFFDPRKYDFSRVGRLKFNIKLFENNDGGDN